MAEFWAIREGNALRAWGAESASLLAKIPFGKPLHVEARQPRNSKHLRLYWTLCARIGDAVGAEREDIDDLLKRRTGHVKRYKTKHGWEERTLSISFKDMDQTAFSPFFERCVDVIYTELGIARADILECVRDLLEKPEVKKDKAA